jgi:hypothetical protein
VRKLTGSTQSGKPLMASVFNEQNPVLNITSDNADSTQQADEAEGFKFVFMGGAQASETHAATGEICKPTSKKLSKCSRWQAFSCGGWIGRKSVCRSRGTSDRYRSCRVASAMRQGKPRQGDPGLVKAATW